MTAKPAVPTSVPERSPVATLAAARDQWVSLGPATVVRGPAARSPRVAGRISALAVSPNGQRVYAGSSLGGVWYSNNAGETWMSLDFFTSCMDPVSGSLQHADALTVGAIGVVWGTDATDVVYVGAGEHPTVGLELPSATLQGVGIRVSTGPAVLVAPVGAAVAGAAAADPWCMEATELAGLAVNQFAVDLVTGGVMWAATSRGLYRRTPAVPAHGAVAVVPAQWTKVVTPFGDLEISAVVTVAGVVAAEPQRIYIATATGRVASSVDGVAWQTIDMTAFLETEVPVAVTRVRLAVAHGPANPVVYALADGPRLCRIDAATVANVIGLPTSLRNADPDGQPPFGLAIAAHPINDAAHRDTVLIGGQAFDSPRGRRQAALFVGQATNAGATWRIAPAAVAAGEPPAEWVGDGVPAGVHALAWLAVGAVTHVWLGGDGGVFRSETGGARSSFVERNTGLVNYEMTSVAHAAGNDGIMLAGTRTNGLLIRRGVETWEAVANRRSGARATGHVGSVAIDPTDPHRMYAQSRGTRWIQSDDAGSTFSPLIFRTSAPDGLTPAERAVWVRDRDEEDTASAAMSNLALLAGPGTVRGTLRVLGTNRIWYTDDALQLARGRCSGWVTLPALTDPYGAAAGQPAVKQDRLDSAVLACVWGSSDRLYALTRQCVYLFQRKADGSWAAPEMLYDQEATGKITKRKQLVGLIPSDLPLAALAVRNATTGKGALYVGTTGPGDRTHVWYYDGSKWIATAFLRDTPVHAILVDPKNNATVYVGTRTGVFKGVATFPAIGDPTWIWSQYCLGLPEAPCVDLTLHSPPGATVRLLRAALVGRGVWEVALDTFEQAPEVYLRSHRFDSRRVDVPVGGARDPFSLLRAQERLDASPDIRVVRGAAAGAPSPLPLQSASEVDYDRFRIDKDSDPFDIWLTQSALRAAGEDLYPSDPWSLASEAALARYRAAHDPAGTPATLWAALMATPFLAERHFDAADLAAYVREEPDRWPKDARASCATDASSVVHVTVHSRHWAPIATDHLSVALLKAPFGRHRSLIGTPRLPAKWDATVRAGAPLGGDWTYADPAHPSKRISALLDPNNPQPVSFDITLDAAGFESPGWLLLAVVLRDGDTVAFADRDIDRLVRTDRRVAARSVRAAALLEEPIVRYCGIDIKKYPGAPAMRTLWSHSNVMWTGVWLRSPADAANAQTPPQQFPRPAGQLPRLQRVGDFVVPAAPAGLPILHPFDGHIGADWQLSYPDLTPQLGTLIMYWGQQDPHNVEEKDQVARAGIDDHVTGEFVSTAPGTHGWRPKGPFDLRPEIAKGNAEDAVAKMTVGRVPRGAVMYLDWERGQIDADGKKYCAAFFHRLGELGYRAGVYCHSVVVAALRDQCPNLFVWHVEVANPATAPTVSGSQLILKPSTSLFDVTRYTIARQWLLDRQLAANPTTVVDLIDLNVSIIQDPSFPERRLLAAQFAWGGVAAASAGGADTVAYAVRKALPVRVAIPGGVIERPISADAKLFWNPLAVPAALVVPGPAANPRPTDLFVGIGFSDAEGDDVARVRAVRRPPDSPWIVETIPDAGLTFNPLGGVVAITRGDESMDVFAVVDRPSGGAPSDDIGLPVFSHFTKADGMWTTFAPAPAGALARNTNRLAAVSRDVGRAQLFWVDDTGRVATTDTPTPTVWTAVRQIGIAAATVHPFASLAAVARDANRIDVLYVGFDAASADWRLIDVWWTTAGEWGANSQVAGGVAVALEALVPIAACKRDADNVDVFVVGRADANAPAGSTGSLYVTTLARATETWSALRPIGGAPASPIASVDSACSDGAGHVQVFVTGREGNVYSTSRAGAADYGPLARIGALNV